MQFLSPLTFVIYSANTFAGSGGNTWKKGASLLPSEAEAPAIRAPFPWPPPASVVVAWIPGKMTSYVYVFASDYAIAQRGYELHPVGLATVI
jgi:hypothetical protein